MQTFWGQQLLLYIPGAYTANISELAQITKVQSFRLLSDVSLVPLKICLQSALIILFW